MTSIKRRTFLKQLAGAAVASAFPLDSFWRKPAMAGEALPRRHLVNIVGFGGWDASPFHNTFSAKHLAGRTDAAVSFSAGGFEPGPDAFDRKYKYTSKCTSIAEEELQLHPDGVTLLGPAMSSVASTEDLQSTLIWKGLEHPGNHEINNGMILHGNTSSYAVSFSGLISQVLADRGRLPLHYVLVADTPAALFTNSAMATDAAIPICIPNSEQFAALTDRNAKEPSDPAVIADIDNTIQRLTLEVLEKRVKLASSKTVVSAFGASLEGARYIYGSNLSSDPELQWLYKYYFLAGLKGFETLSTQDWLTSRASLITFSGAGVAPNSLRYDALFTDLSNVSKTGYTPLPPLAEYLANPSGYAIGDIAGNPAANSRLFDTDLSNPTLSRLRSEAWSFAFADFLIRRNLSAVVDIPAWNGLFDAHGEALGCYLDELIHLELTLGMYFAMIRSLKSVSVPGQGGTLLDATTMVLHTEFDRFAYHEAKVAANAADFRVGTNHAPSASLLLAGYGVRRGRVVGGVHEGPNMTSIFPNQSYLSPLPINLSTGVPSSSGSMANILSIAPTLVSMFGGVLPAQQVTDYDAIPAVIDNS